MFNERSRKGNNHGSSSSGFSRSRPRNHGGPTPMELDSAEASRRPSHTHGKPTKGACYSCGKPGHFARDCRSGKTNAKFATIEKTPAEPETLSHLTHLDDRKESLLRFNGQIDGHPAWILLDSGASWNFINESFVQKHGL